MDQYKKQIEQYIDAHRQEMIEDICCLCRINSEKTCYQEGRPYGEEVGRALTLGLSLAEKYGFSINNYDNYVGTVDLNEGPKQLDILAHLDVVPAGEGWTVTQPFEPIEKDGKLYGRGTADDKGPAVAALYAMRCVKETGLPVSRNVRLILGTDEECGSSDIAHYYDVEEEAPMTFSPDGSFPVVNIEKGGMKGSFSAEFQPSSGKARVLSIHAGTKVNVVPGKAFAVMIGLDDNLIRETGKEIFGETGVSFEIQGRNDTLEITAVGEGAHASTPEDGKNALTALLRLISRLPFDVCEQIEALHRLEQLFPFEDTRGRALGIDMQDELSGELTLAFDLLEVSETSLEGVFDCRSPLCANEENVLEPVRKRLAEQGFTLHNDEMKSPHYVDGDSDFVKTLLRVYERYTGKKGRCESMGGGTYVHDLKNGVAFGAAMPGTDNRMHGADEFAVIDELLTSAKIFAHVILELCGE